MCSNKGFKNQNKKRGSIQWEGLTLCILISSGITFLILMNNPQILFKKSNKKTSEDNSLALQFKFKHSQQIYSLINDLKNLPNRHQALPRTSHRPTIKAPKPDRIQSARKKEPNYFSTISAAKSKPLLKMITIGPLGYSKKDLKACLSKCFLTVTDKNKKTLKIVFFKIAFAKKFANIKTPYIAISGNLRNNLLFLSKITPAEH